MRDYVTEFKLDIEQYQYPDLKPLQQDWRWCHKYAYDILMGRIPSCEKMKHVALRHFRDMQNPEFYFDEEAANSIVTWFRFCPIVKGPKAGSSTVLDPSQIFMVVSLIAWKWKDDKFEYDEDTGQEVQVRHADKRRYNQFYGQVSRKYGKTTILAGLKLYLMYKYGFGPRVFSLATKKDQAKEVWNVAKKMIKLSPRLSRIFDARANDILLPSREGEFKPLASDSNSLDGLDPMAACLDECHAIKDRNLYGVLISAFGSNEGGEFLFSVITTAGFILDGLCTDLYKNGTRVINPDDDIKQENYFYCIFEIDQDDDWSNEKSWYKSNPGLVYGRPSLQYIRDRYQEATMSVEEKGNFLTKHCNLFVNGSDKWLDVSVFKKCARQLDMGAYKDRKCWIGFDRAQVSDITSAAVLFPTDNGGCDVFVFNLQSEGAVKNAPDYLRGIYNKAVEQEDIELKPGEFIRNSMVKEMLIELTNYFTKVEAVGYDPYHMKEIAIELEELGLTMVSVSMSAGNISEPTKNLEMMIGDGRFRYHESVLLEYAAGCAMVATTKFGNTLPYRDPNNVKTDKIDPLIAIVNALSLATLTRIEKNVYEERGLLSI